jgi:hypothetical protein
MKTKSLIAALLLTASSAFAQVPSYVPTNGLVGWWPFNGNANDESGNGNNGTVYGASLVTDRFGIVNSAYAFDGSKYIRTSVGVSSNNSRAISLWIKPTSSSSFIIRRIIVGYFGGGNAGSDFALCHFESNPSAISFKLGMDIRSSYNVFNPALINNSWQHVIVNYSPSFGNTVVDIDIYLNGLLLTNIVGQQLPTTIINSGIGQQPFSIGGIGTLNQSFNGYVDDVAFWNRALTQQEITGIYNNTQTCNSSSNTITADGPTTFCAGNSVNLKSDVVGGTYQWKKNGVNITTNATTKTYKATATGSYTCVATCNGTALTSNAIAVSSKTNAAATVSASGATSFCAGDSVTLNATNLGSNYSVQWYRTNVSMENATNYSQVVKQPGTYKVVTRNLTNGCSRISGSSVVVAVNCRLANPDVVVVDNELNDEAARTIREDMPEVIRIYPNPNEGSFTFEFQTDEEGAGDLQIINVMGQSIYNASVTSTDGFVQHQINLGNQFETGLYIVRYKLNGEQYDRKVILK